jgi:2-oxoglutarate/2-oxoacid ferredoxin oxidoreductase subunit beta
MLKETSMQAIYKHPKSLLNTQSKYCPGCGHGVIHRLVAEAMDELGVQDRTIFLNPVGCAIWADLYFDCDTVQVPHGRTPAGATGVKRMRPDHLVVCYQGDGDLAAIGTAEIVHAANRGEKFTVVFVNNAIYGMTGGQMAPTTLVGQVATTAPHGRDPDVAGMGYPIRVIEMLATLTGTKYLARGAVDTAANVRKTKQYIKKAFEAQLRGEGFTMVEVLSPCPTNWQMSPIEAVDWLKGNMIPYYGLGEIKDELAAGAETAAPGRAPAATIEPGEGKRGAA